CACGQAFGTYVGPGRVVIGRDTRTSGDMLEHAVACGLMAAGCDVVKVGVLPTPTIQIYVKSTGARGGLAVTASHNPPEYNALKLFNSEGLFFNSYERNELIDLYHQSQFRHVGNDRIGRVSTDLTQPPEFHFEKVLALLDQELVRRRRFKVAVDSVNGAGSVMSIEFLGKRLGCTVVPVYCNPTLPFPREAEPRPDTLTDLAARTAAEDCDIGFAQDPDADRLAVVDEKGDVLDNDDVLALAVSVALERKPGNVVTNLSTSNAIADIAASHNSEIYRTPVGEANVVETMLSVDAVIGGEGANGGIIYPGVHCCRDSFTGMAFILDRMVRSGNTISELAAALPPYSRVLGQVQFVRSRLGALLQSLEKAYPEAETDRSDGLKLMMPGQWVHVRPSNTEPILRIAAEARTQAELDRLYGAVLELAEDSGR
ncbi:MAG: phosphoglucosamine mutase, partial [bacterium]|nr:phosphoglucosamine mutase [bacterium]